MAFPTSMTVSVSKGTKGEGSLAHTYRKEFLKKMSKEKQEAFLSKKGHTHIKREYIDLNVDAQRNIVDLFNAPQMEKSLLEYNEGKRKSRQIGKGEALTCAEKKKQLQAVEDMQKYFRLPKKDRQAFLNSLSQEARDACSVAYQKYGSSLRDLQKAHTKLEHTDTLGEAYYKKLLKQKGKKGKLYSEFVIQVGNAADYNEISPTGEIIKSYDRRDPQGVWQQAKNVYLDYLNHFNERNKYMMMQGFSIHMDEEGAPHVQLDLVGIGFRDKSAARGKTRKNGPSIRIGFNAALEAQGFKVDHENPEEAFSAWQAQEQEALADSMKRVLGVERKKGKTNNFENVHEYKDYKAAEAEERARLAEVTKQVEEQEKKKEELTASVKDLQAQQDKAQDDLAKSAQLVQKANDHAASVVKDADDYAASEKAKIASQWAQIDAKEKSLKDGQDDLERRETAFSEKVKKSGNLDQQIATKQEKLDEMDNEIVRGYSSGLDKKKKQLLAKNQKDLDKKKAEQVAEYKKQVDRDKQAYIDDVNRQYRQTLKRREEDLEQREDDQEQREKRFADKIKNLVKNVRIVYISHGLRTVYGTKREVQYHAQQYLQLSKDQQKAVEKQAFSGPGALYSKLSAFKEAVDYIFHGAPDAAELSPLQDLEDLAGEAEAEGRRYNDLQNSRGRGSASPSRSRSIGPEL